MSGLDIASNIVEDLIFSISISECSILQNAEEDVTAKDISTTIHNYYDARYKETQAILRRNLLGKLYVAGLGTPEVENQANRLLNSKADRNNFKLNNKRSFAHKRIVKETMKLKLVEAAKLKNEAKYKRITLERELARTVNSSLFRRTRTIAAKFCSKLWKSKLKSNNIKLNHLKKKFRPTKEYKIVNRVDRNIKILDEAVDELEDKEVTRILAVGITINNSINLLGDLGPKFRVTKKIDLFKEELKLEKLRVQMRRNELEKNKLEAEKAIIEDIAVELDKSEVEQIPFDTQNKHMNLANLKSHEFDINSRTFAPPPMSNEKERDIASYINIVMNTTKEFVESKENQGINVEYSNLPSEIKKGIIESKKLRGDVIITTTDKSNKIAVVSKEKYNEALNKKVDDSDKLINQNDLRFLERENNSITRSVLRICEAGLNSPMEYQSDRLIETLESSNKSASKITLLFKDHKACDIEGNFETRKVINVQDTPGENGGKLLARILDNICDTSKIMIKSSEEALARIEASNNKQSIEGVDNDLKGQEHAGSLDATDMYNKITPDTAEKYVKQSVLKSDWTIDVNVKELKTFLATNMEEHEIIDSGLREVIPRRRSNLGKSPQLVGAEMNSRPNKVGEEKFKISTDDNDTTKSSNKKKKNNNKNNNLTIVENKQIDKDLELLAESQNIQNDKIKLEEKSKLDKLMLETKSKQKLLVLESKKKKREIDLRKSLLLKQTEKVLESKNIEINHKVANDVNVKIETNGQAQLTKKVMTNAIDDNDICDDIPKVNNDKNDENESSGKGEKTKRKKILLSSWAKADREPTEIEVKLMIAIMLSKAVKKLLENQCYEIDDKIYQIIRKGSIGYDLQRCICNIVMEEHGLEVIDLLKEIKQNTDPELEIDLLSDLYFTYVDDIFTKLKAVPNGVTYDKVNKKVYINKNVKLRDDNLKLPEDKKAFNLLTDIVNTLNPELQMKNEVGSDHPELGYAVPFLDTSIWIEEANEEFPNGKIFHQFYEKPSKAAIVIHKESDINERAKRTIHTQEIVRILRNSSRDLPEEVREKGIKNYVIKLNNSGYDRVYISQIIDSGFKAYDKQITANDEGVTPLYRPREWKRDIRDNDKKKKVSNWFKTGGFEHKLLIPSTPNGELKQLIEKNTELLNSKLKIKLIEESGTPLLNVLQKNVAKNDKMPCEDIENCLQCSNDDIGKCRISYITYKLECLEPECHFIYYGETNRNGYSRGREHLQNSQSQTVAGIEKSVISSHAFIHHDGKEIKVKMKMLDRFRADPTGRQNAEAILIRNSSNDILMNGKSEHIQPCDIKERYEKPSGVFEQSKLEKRTKVEKEKLREKIRSALNSKRKSNKSSDSSDKINTSDKRNQNLALEATHDDLGSRHSESSLMTQLPKMPHLSPKVTNDSSSLPNSGFDLLPKMTYSSPELTIESSILPNSGLDILPKMIQLSPKVTNDSFNLPNSGFDLLPKMTYLSPEVTNESSTLPNSELDILLPKMTNEVANLPGEMWVGQFICHFW